MFEFQVRGASELHEIKMNICKVRYTGVFQPPGVDADVSNLLFNKASGLTRKVDDDRLPSLDVTIKRIQGKEFVFFLNRYTTGVKDDFQEKARGLSLQRFQKYLRQGWVCKNIRENNKEWWNLAPLTSKDYVEERLVARLKETQTPLLSQERLRCIKDTLERALADYWARRGVNVNAFSGGWDNFFNEADSRRSKRLSLPELQELLEKRLRSPLEKKDDDFIKGVKDVVKGVSQDDLRALWANVDIDGSGEITSDEWKLALYRIELQFWPDDDEVIVADVVDKMSDAAEKWHQAGGNWYKVFTKLDSDHSGSMEFDEMRAMIRRPLPCLAIPPKIISDEGLRRLWKALDADRSGEVTVQEFMVFMRRRGTRQLTRKDGNRQRDLSNKGRLSLSEQPSMCVYLSEMQALVLCQTLARHSYSTVAAAYKRWDRPFSGSVGELEWLTVTRELLGLSEAQLEDDAVHLVWRIVDPDGVGQVPLEAIFALQDQLKPTKPYIQTGALC